jgi:hypothetical protein
MSLLAALRIAWRWRQLPKLVKRHPGLRRHMPLRIFWKPRHAWFVAFAVTRHPLAAAGWALEAMPSYGYDARGLARAAAELPSQAVIDAVEVAGLAAGSAKHRTLFL